MTSDQSSSGGSDTSGQSGGESFIGSQGTGSDEYLREGGTPDDTGGSDFAKQSRGALDEEEENEEDESGTGSTGGTEGSGSSGGGGSF
jgi:hypothetical protein